MQGYIYIFALLIGCDLLISILGVNIPGSILGLIILFTVFCIKGKTIKSIEESSTILLKYLPLFLVPLGVGVKELITSADVTLAKMVAISIVALVCAVFITIFTIRALRKISLKNEDDLILNANLNGESK